MVQVTNVRTVHLTNAMRGENFPILYKHKETLQHATSLTDVDTTDHLIPS